MSYLQNIAHGSGDMDSDLTLHSWLPYSKPCAWLLSLSLFFLLQQDKQTHRPKDIQKHHGEEKGVRGGGVAKQLQGESQQSTEARLFIFSKTESTLFSKYPQHEHADIGDKKWVCL